MYLGTILDLLLDLGDLDLRLNGDFLSSFSRSLVRSSRLFFRSDSSSSRSLSLERSLPRPPKEAFGLWLFLPKVPFVLSTGGGTALYPLFPELKFFMLFWLRDEFAWLDIGNTCIRVAFHLKGMLGLYEASTRTRSPTMGFEPLTQAVVWKKTSSSTKPKLSWTFVTVPVNTLCLVLGFGAGCTGGTPVMVLL